MAAELARRAAREEAEIENLMREVRGLGPTMEPAA